MRSMTAERPPAAVARPIRAWLELDLDAEPIQGTLSLPGAAANPFTGWLGLTVAIEGLRAVPAPSDLAAQDRTRKEQP